MKYLSIIMVFSGLLINTTDMNGQQDLSSVKDDTGNYFLFDSDQLLSAKEAMEGPYLRFLDIPSMSMGIYSLTKEDTDQQNPHEWDEVYYVLEGKSRCEIEGSQFSVKKGDLIFVKADADHRFIDIEEDLKLLVFFSKKQ